MFEHTQVTGMADGWIALPDGYRPGGTYERTAIGEKAALKMLRDATGFIGKLSNLPDGAPARLIVNYSPALLTNKQIKKEVDALMKYGAKVGIHPYETYDAHKR